MDYQTYAYLQSGQDAAAQRLVGARRDAAVAAPTANPLAGAAPPSAGAYAFAAIPARYALERGDWAAAAKLDGPAEPPPTPTR